MTTEQIHTALIDPRIPALVRVLRDGTDEQVLAASVELCGTTDGRELWDAAMCEAYPGTEDD